ncbi:MAG: serine hydrolase [Ignavibacteria bacterium]|nr:serine hydrolase [Ignavibacteria bacterium]
MLSMRTLSLVIMTLSPTIGMSQGYEKLRLDVHQMLETVPGFFAVAFKPGGDTAALLINERAMFHAASTMKTPVMIEVFRQARKGQFSLDDSVSVRNEFKSIVDGSLYELDLKDDSDDSMYKRIGGKTSVRDLIYQMITVSSNLATNILIGLVGAEKVTRTMRQLGAHDIEVLRGVEDGKAFERGMNNRTNAYDLLLILEAIAEGRAVDPSSSKAMVDVLLAQQFGDLIPALLPPNVRVAHKTGSITGVEHDSGIVYLPDGRRYVLVLLSKDLKNIQEGKRALARVSKRIYDFMIEGE